MKAVTIIITGIITNNIFRIACFLFLIVSISGLSQENPEMDTLYLKEVEIIGDVRSAYPVMTLDLKNFRFEIIHDLGDFLRAEPNISGIRKGGIAIDPVVRGFKYNQVAVVLNNGVKIEGGCPNRMDPTLSHVENENVAKIEVVKGPYVLQYGPVLGALINIRTKSPTPSPHPFVHGKVLYGFESNWDGKREHFELSGGNKSVYFSASGGCKNYGGYKGGNDISYNTAFKKSYVTATAGINLNEKHLFDLRYAYNQGKDVQFPALPMDEQLDKTHVTSLSYQWKNPGKRIKSLLAQGYISMVHHVMDNYDRPAAKTMKAVTTVDAMDCGGKMTAVLQKGGHKILAGIDFEHIWKDGEKRMTMQMVMEGDTFVSVKTVNVFNNTVWNNAGLFIEYKIPVEGMDLTLAARLDFNQANSSDTFKLIKEGVAWSDDLSSVYFNPGFSAGMEKQLINGFSLNAGLGFGTRSPSIVERFIKLMPVQFDSYDYLGNPHLKPEKNLQADLRADYQIHNAGILSAGGFFSLVFDYITGKIVPPSVIKPSTQGVTGVKQFSNIGPVYLAGFELTFRTAVERKWNLGISAAATYGTNPEGIKYIYSDGEVIGEEEIKNDPLPEIPPLEGTVDFAWKFFKNKLVPRVNVRFVSAQNRTSEAFTEEGTPGFITAGASLDYIPCNYFSISAGVENITDNAYYEHLNRRVIGSSEPLYEPGRIFYVNFVINF